VTLLWIGSICYALATFPQTLMLFRTKNASGISWGMVELFGAGASAFVGYAALTRQWPMVLGNLGTLFGAFVIAYYKAFPGKAKV
jgi:MtN3 and saliva related transmembrane protein